MPKKVHYHVPCARAKESVHIQIIGHTVQGYPLPIKEIAEEEYKRYCRH